MEEVQLTNTQPLTYVISIHGMGEQRLNETLLPIVSRLADRELQPKEEPRNVLTLGMATAQTGWYDVSEALANNLPLPGKLHLEFDKLEPPGKPFLGLPGTNSNLRFLDIHWADLLSRGYTNTGQEVDQWVESLVGRFERKIGNKPRRPERDTMHILYNLEETVDAIHRILKLKSATIDRVVFSQYLGDCQVYGDYYHSRGEAVYRFHRLMEALHQQRPSNREVRYVILAHSLGSVMALDALMYAHASPTVRSGAPQLIPGLNNYPLHGYRNQHPPSVEWVKDVSHFVTLGSAIDKYLNLWWFNYDFLNQPVQWIDPSLDAHRKARPIEHHNYSDQQDPVGERLNTLRAQAAFGKVFKKGEERIFNRYPLPLFAHTGYWRDQSLFNWIWHKTGITRTPPEPPKWMKPGIYAQVLFISYILLPILFSAAVAIPFLIALSSERWYSSVISGVLLVGILWVGKRLTSLSIYWRQSLKRA